MTVEAANFIGELDTALPSGGDVISEGDDHLRLIKAVLQATFPNAAAAFPFPSFLTKTGAYSVIAGDQNKIIEVNAAAAFDLTLPAVAGLSAGWSVTLLRVDATAFSVNAKAASGTIQGNALIPLYQHVPIQFYYNGTSWRIDYSARPDLFHVLTNAASIAWDMSKGKHASVTITANRAMANPTGQMVGAEGYLVVSTTGAFNLTWGADFNFPHTIKPKLPTAGTATFRYFVAAPGLIYIWQVAGGSFIEYDLGSYNLSTQYSQAHSLGTYPRLIELYLECTTTDRGFAVGDRILIGTQGGADISGGFGGTARGTVVLSTSETTVNVATGSDRINIPSKTGGTPAGMGAGDWKFILRVHA